MNSLTTNNSDLEDDVLKSLPAVIILLGIGLRIFHFIYNRSLWMDEVYLSSSLLHLNYAHLAQSALDYQQKAPVLFLWAVKLAVNIFGNNEMALRSVPLISGIVSLFLFSRVCRYFVTGWAHILALIIFTFAPALIYHSVEIKQYATECLATVIALYLFTRYHNAGTYPQNILWGLFGAIVIWFSHAVIFILAGMAIGISLYYLFTKQWKLLFTNSVSFLFWLLSFGLNYILLTHKHAEANWVVYWFKTYSNFMPLPPHNFEELKWFPRNFLQMLDYPLGLAFDVSKISQRWIKIVTLPIIAILFYFTGIYTLCRNQLKIFLALICPIGLMLVASGLQLYPLLERFWLFIAPIFILFIALGFDYWKNRIKSINVAKIGFIVVASWPVISSIYYIVQPDKFYKHKKSYEKEGLQYISNNFKKNDVVYNYWNNSPGYGVYTKINQYSFQAIDGKDYRAVSKNQADYNTHLQNDFHQFAGKKRVWLMCNKQILSNIGDPIDQPLWYYKGKLSPVNNILQEFSKLGKPLKKIVYSDVIVYLITIDQT